MVQLFLLLEVAQMQLLSTHLLDAKEKRKWRKKRGEEGKKRDAGTGKREEMARTGITEVEIIQIQKRKTATDDDEDGMIVKMEIAQTNGNQPVDGKTSTRLADVKMIGLLADARKMFLAKNSVMILAGLAIVPDHAPLQGRTHVPTHQGTTTGTDTEIGNMVLPKMGIALPGRIIGMETAIIIDGRPTTDSHEVVKMEMATTTTTGEATRTGIDSLAHQHHGQPV